MAARAFSPMHCNRRGQAPCLMPVCDLLLPDGSQPAGLPVLFEGRLQRFERRIGVVWVWLQAPSSPEPGANGLVHFRGESAVVLRGPAVVELAFPFQVERLPVDPGNYWRDLRVPRAQFEFSFGVEVSVPMARLAAAPSSGDPEANQSCPPRTDAPERRLPAVDSPEPSAVDQSYGGYTVRGDDASHCQREIKQRFTT